jgi:hypothetical protein
MGRTLILTGMDLDWLDARPVPPRDLSRYGREGVFFGLVLRATGWSVAEAARQIEARALVRRPTVLLDCWPVTERKIRKRLVRAELEFTRDVRPCQCACGRPLPASATARRWYVDDAHGKRGRRKRAQT